MLKEFKEFAIKGNMIDMAAVSYTHLEHGCVVCGLCPVPAAHEGGHPGGQHPAGYGGYHLSLIHS